VAPYAVNPHDRVLSAAQGEEASRESTESWPQSVSHAPTMRISDVLGLLRTEFPAVTHSKIRFLEDQGLITPVRSPAGYRTFSSADVERLRFVLTEQRDRYLPLKVIKDKLAQLDSGAALHDHPLGPRVASVGGLTPAQAEALEFSNTAVAAGVPQEFVDELVDAGILRGHAGSMGSAARLEQVRRDVEIVKVARQLRQFGIDWRHLRSMRSAADRQVSVIDQSVAHLAGRKSGTALEEAAAARSEMAELLLQLHGLWLRDGVAEL